MDDRIPAAGRTIYLTFDDGPDPRWTPQVLRLLKQYGAHATFFEVGVHATEHPSLVRQVRQAGHRIGNHSWDHSDLTKLGPTALSSQLDRTATALGQPLRCVRPPYGAVNKTVTNAIHSRHQHVALWDVDTRDWSKPGANAIAQQAISGAHPGAVILMHDGGGDRSQSIAALATVLRNLHSRGYQLKSLPTC
ncbi:polysaccharide deacetylase [Luteipulveratus mongoliensis]|uniref:Polysaccharide deacetylase n=2 Tax=Luteipulveratus mongoliensis TaxID=571913 RepID=A0A0K1JPW8_9MICO|nr:polysaccharide deacetylase [Luteipulveratus mongoliensis]